MNILIADDRAARRHALRAAWARLDGGAALWVTDSLAGALDLAGHMSGLEMLLLGLGSDEAEGRRALGVLRRVHPGLPVVVVADPGDHAGMLRALDAGAMGYIDAVSPGVLCDAVRTIAAGGLYLPPSFVHAPTLQVGESESTYDAPGVPDGLGLTPRQTDVLALLVQGKPNKLICRELGLAEGTVKIHVSAILKALGVANRTQAVIALSCMGFRLAPPPRATPARRAPPRGRSRSTR